MEKIQNQKSYPRVYWSTRFKKNTDYRKPGHEKFFYDILEEIQDDFENNGFRLNSVINMKSKQVVGVDGVNEIWQTTREHGDLRPLWSYASNWKGFDPIKYNANDVIIFEMAAHPVTDVARAIEGRNYKLVPFRKPKVLLDQEQQKHVENNNDVVVVEGSAGSGKTVVCVEKLKNIWLNHKYDDVMPRVLFLSYSVKLIKDIIAGFNEEIKKLKNIVDDIKEFGLTDGIKNKPILKDLNISLEEDVVIDEIEKYIDFIDELSNHGVKYESLQEAYIKNKTIVNYDIFKNFYNGEYETQIPDALKNDIEKNNIDLEYYFNEIEGVILGNLLDSTSNFMTMDNYMALRKENLMKQLGITERKTIRFIETLHAVFKKYQELLSGEFIDRNEIATQLIYNNAKHYDYIIIDEVQDLTQREIAAYIGVGNKLLFAGDTMQMINPTYFSFGALKDIYNRICNRTTSIKDDGRLKRNYRNSSAIYNFANKWIEVSETALGILGSQRTNRLEMKLINNQFSSNVYFISDSALIDRILKLKQGTNRNIELIDSVAAIREMKGREADNVVLLNLLSSNYDKWFDISNKTIVKKLEDENSVNRYYFNLFYVAITRARNNLFIVEELNDDKNVCDLKLFKETHLFDSIQILTNDISDEELEELFEEMDDFDIEIKINELLDSGAYVKALKQAQTLSFECKDRKLIIERCKIYVDYVIDQQFDKACEMFLSKKFYYDAAYLYSRIGKEHIARFLKDLENSEQVDESIALKIYYSEQNKEIQELAKSILDDNKNLILRKLDNSLKLLKEVNS